MGSGKKRRNLARHGIAFEDAVRIFEGPTLEKVDDRFEYGEVRVHAVGVVNGIEITVIYTDVSGTERRIISAWKAERMKEKRTVVVPAAKQTITIRLDADLLEWLRKQKGYQTRINAVLRTYMDANLTPARRG